MDEATDWQRNVGPSKILARYKGSTISLQAAVHLGHMPRALRTKKNRLGVYLSHRRSYVRRHGRPGSLSGEWPTTSVRKTSHVFKPEEQVLGYCATHHIIHISGPCTLIREFYFFEFGCSLKHVGNCIYDVL
jgi:hypothetical protein